MIVVLPANPDKLEYTHPFHGHYSVKLAELVASFILIFHLFQKKRFCGSWCWCFMDQIQYIHQPSVSEHRSKLLNADPTKKITP